MPDYWKDWNAATQAPPHLFRVIGENEQRPPALRYWIGDYPDLGWAKFVANQHATPTNPVAVFDDENRTKCLTWGSEVA